MNLLNKIIKKIQSLIYKVPDELFPRLFYRNRFTSIIYYLLFSNSFNREYQSVLAGKAKHLKEAKNNEGNYFLLVRNIHRLEKGLLMRPRREVFAEGYIKETMDSYSGIMKNAEKYEPSQIKWFSDVLTEYFTVVGNNTKIDTEKGRFNKIKIDKGHQGPRKIPYFRNDNDKSPISYDDFYRLSRQRRSVRWFEDMPVPRDLIDKALEVALQAPSACNRQPFEFRIFDEPDMVQKISNTPMGTVGYANNIQSIAVVVGKLDAYFSERDRHIIYIDASLASMSFMYALETLNLSSCPINWPDIEDREKKMDKILNLELHERPIMLIAIGYPHKEGKVAFSEKRSIKLARRYN
jgi:nitroreductase